MNDEKALQQLVDKHLDLGFFTHFYAECGLLNQREPFYKTAVLPDGRDLFDLSSLTKALVTTPLIFRDLLKRNVSAEEKVSGWLKKSKSMGLAEIPGEMVSEEIGRLTIKSLLRHESGLPFWQNFYVQCQGRADEAGVRLNLLEGLAKGAHLLPNAGKSVYSDPGFLLLGRCLEVANKMSLDQLWGLFLSELFADEPKVDSENFLLGYPQNINKARPDTLSKRAIPTGPCAIRGRLLCGEVHDENSWALGGVTGHAGVFGSGEAVTTYLKKLATHPVGISTFNENAAAIKPGPNESLMGWRQAADPSSETFGGGQAMGHMGFTGVAFWVTKDGKYSVLLTNRVSSGRVSPLTRPFRREALSALWNLCSRT